MIYVFCPRNSTGAKELTRALNELKVKAERIKSLNKAERNNLLINWGAGIPGAFIEWFGAKNILNPKVSHNKYNELLKMREGGVPVPPFSLRKEDPSWLARTAHHTEARDLLGGLKVGDYYVQYIPTVREFRVHILNGKSIRAGIKSPRVANPNERFRSWSAGWKLDYGNPCQESITNRIREAAREACASLKYNFGAVDIGVKRGGEPVVFEVNSAPGLEGNTIKTYAQKFKEVYNARNS